MSDNFKNGNGSAAVDPGNANGVTTEDVVLTERDKASTEPTSVAYPLKLHSDVNLVTVSRCDDADSLASDSRVVSRKPRYSIRKMGDGYYDIYIPDGNVSAHHCAIYKKGDGYYLYDGAWYLKDGKFSPTGEGPLFQGRTSTNYTRLNGERFEDNKGFRLSDGDTVTIGKTIKFRINFK